MEPHYYLSISLWGIIIFGRCCNTFMFHSGTQLCNQLINTLKIPNTAYMVNQYSDIWWFTGSWNALCLYWISYFWSAEQHWLYWFCCRWVIILYYCYYQLLVRSYDNDIIRTDYYIMFCKLDSLLFQSKFCFLNHKCQASSKISLTKRVVVVVFAYGILWYSQLSTMFCCLVWVERLWKRGYES